MKRLTWLLFGVCWPLSLASAQPAQQPSGPGVPPRIAVDAFAQLPFISDPQLSPDGRKILARLDVNGTEQLAIYDLPVNPDVEPKLVPTPGGFVRWFGWAGNGRVLIGYRSFALFMNILPVPTSRLRSFDIASGQTTEVGNTRGIIGDKVIFTDPNGRYILLSVQDYLEDTPSIDRVDLATGKGTEVQGSKGGVWNWFADSSGNVRGGISYSEKAWTIYYRNAAGQMARAGSGRFSAEDSAVDSIHLLPGSDSGVMVTNGPTGRFAVYNFQLGSGSLGTPIFEHPLVDVTDIRISADGSRVAGVSYEDDRPRVKWLTPELERLQATIDKTFPGKDNRIVDMSHDQNVVLFLSASADDPGTYYAFDRAARRMSLLARPYDKLESARFAPVKPVSYPARDGLAIPAYLTLPEGRDPKGLPLIVMPHGGPFVRDSSVFNPWVQLLANRGYAVLQPNFRGSTGYGRDFVERGYGEMGKKMQDDLDDGVAWLTADGTIDPKRVCVMGASYGGYAALWGAIRNPELYRCAISFAGVTDVRAMLKYDQKYLIAGRYFKIWRKRLVGEEARDLGAVSPLQQAARLNIPVLVAHGARDGTVPVEQGRKMVAALNARSARVQSVFYPEAAHGLDRTEDSVDFLRRVEAFLEVHNPADLTHAGGAREAQLVSGEIALSDLPDDERKKKGERKVGLSYTVTADGRVTACTVARTSGSRSLDTLACRIAEERFQYRPARNAAGAYEAASVGRDLTLRPAPKA